MKNQFFKTFAFENPALLICIAALQINCESRNEVMTAKPDPSLVFQSGFENTRLAQRGDFADMSGADPAFTEKNDWVKDLADRPDFGKFAVQYHVGDSSMRNAQIIAEPGKPSNHVMSFWLDKPLENGGNGRIQANMYGNTGMKEFSYSVRMFLSEDLKTVYEYPKEVHWLTIAEFWNNITWSQTVPNRFRITVGLGKPSGTVDHLNFIVDAEDCELFPDDRQKYTKVWVNTNNNIPVPIGKWVTMEYYYKEGNASTGQFRVSMQPEGGSKQTIFDIKNFTHNSTDTNPDGVSDLNPMKLYTSKDLMLFMKSKNKHCRFTGMILVLRKCRYATAMRNRKQILDRIFVRRN